MSKIKAVFFDMDGVLVDAKEWHYEALNKSLRLFGFEISKEEHLSAFDGLPTKVKLEMLSQRGYLPKGLHGFINEMKQQYTYDLVHVLCKPRFNTEHALSRLKADGYKLAVASNSIRYTVELMMQKSCLTQYLDHLVSNEDVAKAKPSPEIYQVCMKKFGLRPDECVVVEDNENGIRAARDAGAHVLVVKEVAEVTYSNVKSFIRSIEEKA
ncbi:HAD family phosphatase [Bdellovibrio sp. SKB1291214]|uniref:HAD family hydrolase n=1 Tax=Bdellovibrio sp. SKB1291214 TaxID=1732569 RepID=UPI000B5185A3|nr:HAD family phosphatase [Bdellovibrio sp. SKB1291214]UYL08303.1 HAD family phosphatase [Bdellovibrio sp. SKB1291214]